MPQIFNSVVVELKNPGCKEKEPVTVPVSETSWIKGDWTWSGIFTAFFDVDYFLFSVMWLLLPINNVLGVVPFPHFISAAQPHRDFIITQGRHLMCKIIIHILGKNDVRKMVYSVLEECGQRKYTSVSLLAIRTGLQPLIIPRFWIIQIPLGLLLLLVTSMLSIQQQWCKSKKGHLSVPEGHLQGLCLFHPSFFFMFPKYLFMFGP